MSSTSVAGSSTTTSHANPDPAPGASTPTKSLCASCHTNLAIYTCPRCAHRSCSQQCVADHKTRTACSGVRDRAAFVPMNRYGWGTLVNDYTFLEDVARHVGAWGADIAKGGIGRGGMSGQRGTVRGRGKRLSRVPGGNKRDFLSLQLGFRDIDMDILPLGMERHRLNQSTWDSKKKTAMLTIEFIFHPLQYDSLSTHFAKPVSFLTHRNSIDVPLRQLVQGHVGERMKSKKDAALPDWLVSLVGLDADAESDASATLCVMKCGKLALNEALVQTQRTPRLVYHKLEWERKLSTLLRFKQFVEYPTIEVMEKDAFVGTLVDAEGVARDTPDERESKHKRRRLDVGAGKRAINGLLGGYGSDVEEGPSALQVLEHYSGSDEGGRSDDDVSSLDGGPDLGNNDSEISDDGGAEEDNEQRDSGMPQFDGHALADDDEVNWRDSSEDEADEAKLAALLAAVQQRTEGTIGSS